MTFQHLDFGQLSDLFDDEVTDKERKQYTLHIQECSTCRKEYESLCMCLSMLKGSKSACGCIPDICHDTIGMYKSRERKRQYLKSVPAIAASVLLITGFGFLHTDQFRDDNSFFLAQISTEKDFQRIVDSIRDSHGNILHVNAEYIDGEVPSSSLMHLERMLHYFRIKHTVIYSHPAGRIADKINGIEDVSYSSRTLTGSSMFGRGNSFINNNAANENVRVRIFK